MGATPQEGLREELAARRAVVIVGAGVSVAATGGVPVASWVGLLEDGVAYCESLLGASLPNGWAERRRGQLASGDSEELISAAGDITRRLGGPDGGEFARWLQGGVGGLKATKPAVLEALAALGVPLATTNYDGLLEAATGRPAVTWRQGGLVERVVRGDHQAILHLHGHWQDPGSVVLGVRSYEAVLGDAHAVAMRNALASTRTLVFVGCGAGLADPNFGALRRWLAVVFASSPYRHYRLCLKEELADLWREHGLDERIVPLAYGDGHDDLGPFLRMLVSGTTTVGSASIARPAVPAPEQEARVPSALPRIWNVPQLRNPAFTGREDVLEALAAARGQGAAATAITQTIAGLGGVGKTSLAVEYAYRQSSQLDVVWWLRAEKPATLLGDFTGLASALELPETAQSDPSLVVRGVHRWLADHDRWLLVFDNANRPEELTPLLPPAGRGQVLVTSRWAAWGEWARPMQLKVMSRKEAVAFVGRRTGTTDEQIAAALAEAMGDLPLALAEAAAYIEQTQLGLYNYLRLVQERAVDLFGLRQPTGAQRRVATVWSLSLERVREEAPGTEALLDLCAFLAPEDIPRDLFSEHAAVLPEELRELAGDLLAYNEALGVLGGYSLVTVTPTSLGLHRLVQAVIRARLDQKEVRWARVAIELIDAAFPVESWEVAKWAACQRILPHLLAVTEHAERLDIAGDVTSRLLDRASTYLRGRGQPAEALPLAKRALTVTEQALGPDHPTVGDRHDELGRALSQAGDYQGARQQLERALAIHKSAYGPDDRRVGADHNELGIVLQQLGDLTGARAELEQAIEIHEANLGPDHPESASVYSNLGAVLADLGDLDGARTQFERGLEIGKATLGPDHPDMAIWHTNLGVVLDHLGDLKGARIHLERALEIGQATLGPDHPKMAIRYSNLGSVLCQRGDLEGARTQLEGALEISEATLGSDHPQTATLYSNLGDVLRQQGDLEGARTQLEQALEIGEATVGPNHPTMATRHSNLGLVLRDLGDLAGARTQFERALKITEATVGPDHPNMASTHSNLGTVLGDLAGARIHLERALEIGQATLGPDHPDMALLRRNLDSVPQQLGDE